MLTTEPFFTTLLSPCKQLELVSKVSSAAVGDTRAATSSNFAKKSSAYLGGYASGFLAHFPRLAARLAALATKLLLRPVLLSHRFYLFGTRGSGTIKLLQ
jgi:hypothetical protein